MGRRLVIVSVFVPYLVLYVALHGKGAAVAVAVAALSHHRTHTRHKTQDAHAGRRTPPCIQFHARALYTKAATATATAGVGVGGGG